MAAVHSYILLPNQGKAFCNDISPAEQAKRSRVSWFVRRRIILTLLVGVSVFPFSFCWFFFLPVVLLFFFVVEQLSTAL